MESITENEKQTFKKKLLEFQRSGLISYGVYLTNQLAYASKLKIRNAYKKYVEDQIAMNLHKINEIEKKLNC